jgi:SAM-dependent methyltransferase/uncharacterized protein YbaR (Trm112 family)
MLKSLQPKLCCPTCRQPNAGLDLHVFRDGIDAHVRDGVLVCGRCGGWYPIENYVLELVLPALLNPDEAAAFATKFQPELRTLGVDATSPQREGALSDAGVFDEQIKQRIHFDHYAEAAHSGFSDYTESPFIRAASSRYLRLWLTAIGPVGGWVLDIGCGTGICSFPIAEQHTVIGFDISKRTIEKVVDKALAQNRMARTTFFVGDGGYLAFKPGSFDHVQTFGSLHHLPDPCQAMRQIQEILVPGGTHFAVENNQTIFRGIFDLMMKIYPLWIEEAGAEPLISRAMVDEWCRGLPVAINSQTSIFLPPHLFNLLGFDLARSAVDWSDRICTLVPGLRHHGGQLVLETKKLE